MTLFFIRRYNDIDHIVPIVYRMSKDGVLNVVILCLTMDYDLENDSRLLFLQRNHDVKIDYLYRYFGSSVIEKLLFNLAYISRNFSLTKVIFKKIYNSMLWQYIFNEKWIRKSLTKYMYYPINKLKFTLMCLNISLS